MLSEVELFKEMTISCRLLPRMRSSFTTLSVDILEEIDALEVKRREFETRRVKLRK